MSKHDIVITVEVMNWRDAPYSWDDPSAREDILDAIYSAMVHAAYTEAEEQDVAVRVRYVGEQEDED